MKMLPQLIGIFLCTLVFAVPSLSYAQGAGIKVIPAQINELTDPGKILNQEIKITNVSGEDNEYYIYKRDIKGVEEGGVPIFTEDAAEKTGYEISEWISLQTEPISIPAGETVSFPFTINVPENASPCSHFGGIFVSHEAPKLREIGAGVGYEIASIISIRVSGECVDDARIRAFSTDKLFYSTKNVKFTAKIENQGNILIRPRGPLTITSMLGGKPETILVNDDLAAVFPRTVREISFDWNSEGIGFGRYEAVLALGYDGVDGQKTIDATVVFWVFPTKIIVPILIGFASIVVLGYLLTRYYINQAVMRAAGGRRISTYRYRKQVGISRFTFVLVSIMGAVVIFLIVLLIVFA